MDWVQVVELLFTGGVLVGFFTLPATIKRANAEARSAELDNLQKVADGWKELAEERQEANKEKDDRIAELTANVDARYVDIGQWRDKYNAMQEENTELKVQIASTRIKICEKAGCADRTPPTGY